MTDAITLLEAWRQEHLDRRHYKISSPFSLSPRSRKFRFKVCLFQVRVMKSQRTITAEACDTSATVAAKKAIRQMEAGHG